MSGRRSPRSATPPLPFAGELRFDSTSLAAAADDFGHLVRRHPRVVARPHTADDVVGATRWAATKGWEIAARGEGHSLYGRSQVADGLVVDMSALNRIHHIGADHIVVDAGVTWRALLAETLPRRLTPPVLTNFLDLSVGGTLSVGGLGATTHRHGLQTDHVFELEVVTGEGRRLTCSAQQRADLFDAVRAGLGQFGIITRASLALIPAPQRVRTYVLGYPDLVGLATDQRTILHDMRADHLQGSILPGETGWQHQLEMATFVSSATPADDDRNLAGLADDRSLAQVEDVSYREYVQTFDAYEGLLRSSGAWANPHPWWTTFLPGSAAERIAGDVLDTLAASDLGEYGRVIFHPIATDRITTPLVRLPAEEVAFALHLIRFSSGDPGETERMLVHNAALYEQVRAAGGVLYPVSGFRLTPADWRVHFAERWPAFRSAKEHFDPRRALNPGQGMFGP